MQKLRVLEFEGLAPSVMCGLFFSDLGADVVIVARHEPPAFSIPLHTNLLNRNKRCVCLNLKSPNDLEIIKLLLKSTDVVIDPFRPGVLEKAGLGPEEIWKLNPRVILLRVSGFGQEGEHSLKPGHDLTYIGMSGILSKFGQQEKPQFPNNYVADFAGLMFGITGTLAALHERDKTGKGQVVDCSLMHCSRYLSLPLINYKEESIIKKYRTQNDQEFIASFSTQKQCEDFEKKQPKAPIIVNLPEDSITITPVVTLKELPQTRFPVDPFRENFIMPAKNSYGFEFTNPVLMGKTKSKAAPERGQHTEQVLMQRGIPGAMIKKALHRQKGRL